MSRTISERVGKGGKVRPDHTDVKTVNFLLNLVKRTYGGAEGTLPSKATPVELEDAICSFQAYHFGQTTGFVDANGVTMNKLNQYEAGSPPGPDGVAMLFKATREQIVEQARPMVGKVSNVIDRETKRRHGWQELWEIFTGAEIDTETEEQFHARMKGGWHPLPKGSKAIPFDEFLFVRGGCPGGVAWCGVFATWVLNQVGFNVKWVLRTGIHFQDGAPVSKVGRAGVSLGDVCIVDDFAVVRVGKSTDYSAAVDVKFHLAHHVIVASNPDPQGNFDAIEGNFPDQSYGAHCIVDRQRRMPAGPRNVNQILHRYELFQPLSL